MYHFNTYCVSLVFTVLLSPVPQPAAAPAVPVPVGLGVFGCPGTPPASGISERTGSDNLSSTLQSPSPWTDHTTQTPWI